MTPALLRPVIDRTFPFAQTTEAMAYVEQGRTKAGKVVVMMPSVPEIRSSGSRPGPGTDGVFRAGPLELGARSSRTVRPRPRLGGVDTCQVGK